MTFHSFSVIIIILWYGNYGIITFFKKFRVSRNRIVTCIVLKWNYPLFYLDSVNDLYMKILQSYPSIIFYSTAEETKGIWDQDFSARWRSSVSVTWFSMNRMYPTWWTARNGQCYKPARSSDFFSLDFNERVSLEIFKDGGYTRNRTSVAQFRALDEEITMKSGSLLFCFKI